MPVAFALIAGTHAIIRALRADRTPIVWIRAGAAGGIVAVAVQNLFEMTLRVPANAIMLAVLAAIATHASRQSPVVSHQSSGSGAPVYCCVKLMVPMTNTLQLTDAYVPVA